MIFLGRRTLPLCCSLIFCLFLDYAPAENIIATVGRDVTLICNYNAQHYGSLSVCWGRGTIPNRGCANEVIKSDGTSVTSRLSERYMLNGNLEEGDVSLTIRQVQETDSGMYGCRVEIPGWFNDHKHQITLSVVAVRPYPLKVETREVKARSFTIRWTPGFDGGRPITSYMIDLKNKQASWDTAVRIEVSNPGLTELALVDLRPDKTYSLRMFANNHVGMSDASNILTVTTKEAAPEGPPLQVLLESLTPHSIKVTWQPPRSDLRNGVLRSYSISYREYDSATRQFKGWQHLSVKATREVESIILNNLKPSTKYDVLIKGQTSAGVGPAANALLHSTLDEVQPPSTASTSTTAAVWMHNSSLFSVHSTSTAEPDAAVTVWGDTVWGDTVWGDNATTSITSVPPDPPVVEVKEVQDNTFSVIWTPGFEGDSPITGYFLEYKAANALWDHTKTVVDFSPDQTEATILEMNPSTYNLRMFAKNRMSTSKASNVLTIATGVTGHHMDNFVTSIPKGTHTAASIEERPEGHLAAVVVPVVLVVLILAMLAIWQLCRIKQKNGDLNVELTGAELRYRGSEPLSEL